MMECPGVVVHTGPGSTYLGADDHADMITSDFLVHVADLMSRAGLSAQVRNDVDAIVWQKITVNAALNALTTILRYVCVCMLRLCVHLYTCAYMCVAMGMSLCGTQAQWTRCSILQKPFFVCLSLSLSLSISLSISVGAKHVATYLAYTWFYNSYACATSDDCEETTYTHTHIYIHMMTMEELASTFCCQQIRKCQQVLRLAKKLKQRYDGVEKYQKPCKTVEMFQLFKVCKSQYVLPNSFLSYL